jgi:DNA anti-recombination protein RmuC
MADEPENHTLRLLREMREETNRRFDEMREETNHRCDGMRENTNRRFDEMREENRQMHAQTRAGLASVLESIVEMARTVNRTAEAVTKMAKEQERHSQILTVTGSRLNTIDQRLALMEEYTGFVKA